MPINYGNETNIFSGIKFQAAELTQQRILSLQQGYYNTGWFNSKIRSQANLLICQQTNIKAKLKCFSDKVTDFQIEPTFNGRNLDNKLSYEKITLAGMGVEVNHETLISTSWSCQIGTENLLRGGRSIISRLIAVISRGALSQTDNCIFNGSFLDSKLRPASREVILKPTCI